MDVTVEDVAAKIRERREVVRQSLLSIDDEEVATYRIEITTDNSGQKAIPPRFSWNGGEEYLAEFDFVPAEKWVEEVNESNPTGSVHSNQSMPVDQESVGEAKELTLPSFVHSKQSMTVDQDEKANDAMKKDSVDVKSTPVTKKEDVKESIQPISRLYCFRKKKQEEETFQPEIVTMSSYDSVEMSVKHVKRIAPVERVARFSPFRRKKPAKETVKPESSPTTSPLLTKRSGVTYLEASIEPATKSTPVKEWSAVSAASIEPVTKSTPVRGMKPRSISKRSGVTYIQASADPATKSTPVEERSVASAASIEADKKSMPESPPATKRSGVTYFEASVAPAAISTPIKERSVVSDASIGSHSQSTPGRKTEDVKESIQPEAKSTPVKTEKDLNESVVDENVDEKFTPVKGSKGPQVTFDIGNVSTPVKKNKEDDDTKSITTASSESDRVSLTKSPPTAVQNKNGTNKKVVWEPSLIDGYLERILDKVCGPCHSIPAPSRCTPLLEEEDEMEVTVENVLAEKFQRSKQKARERKTEKKADKQKQENKANKKKSHETIILPRVFVPPAKRRPPSVEWGTCPSDDESERSMKRSVDEIARSFVSSKGFTVGQFLQTKEKERSSPKGKYSGENEVNAKVLKEEQRRSVKEEQRRSVNEKRSSAGNAILSVTPVRLNKKKEFVGRRSVARSDKHNEKGPDENEDSDDATFNDVDDDSQIESDSDSEYTTEVVKVDFDPAKLAGTTDADKYLAREVLRRYAEMTGVSLDELIEEVVDESMASITLDTFPTLRD